MILRWQGLESPAPTIRPMNFWGRFRTHGSSGAWTTIGTRFAPSALTGVQNVLGQRGIQWSVVLTRAQYNSLQGKIDFALRRISHSLSLICFTGPLGRFGQAGRRLVIGFRGLIRFGLRMRL